MTKDTVENQPTTSCGEMADAVKRLEALFTNHEDIYPHDVRAVLDELRDLRRDLRTANDALLCKVEDQAGEIEGLRSSVSSMIDACNTGNIDSNLVCGFDDGVPATRWHEEWAHYAKKALKGGA